MIQRPCLATALLAMAGLTSSPVTQAVEAPQAVQSAAHSASGSVVKAEQAVKRSARRADAAIQRGTRAAGQAVSHTARKLGLPTASESP